MEAVGADLDEEGIDEETGKALAAIVDEAVAKDGEVVEKIGGAGVGHQRGVGWERDARLGGC